MFDIISNIGGIGCIINAEIIRISSNDSGFHENHYRLKLKSFNNNRKQASMKKQRGCGYFLEFIE